MSRVILESFCCVRQFINGNDIVTDDKKGAWVQKKFSSRWG